MIRKEHLIDFQNFIYDLNPAVKRAEKHYSLGDAMRDATDNAISSWKLDGKDFKIVNGRKSIAEGIKNGKFNQKVLHCFVIYFIYNIHKDFSQNATQRANQLMRLETFFSWINPQKTKEFKPKETQELIDYLLVKINLPTLKCEVDINFSLCFFEDVNGKFVPFFKKRRRKKFDFPDSTSNDPAPDTKKKYNRASIIVILFSVIAIAFFGNNYLTKQERLKQQEIEQERILSNASMLHSGYTHQLNQLQAAIEEELRLKTNVLSKLTIDRIISLSDNLKPYRYLENKALSDKPYSRERADLFRYIIQLNLSDETYRTIFDKANFSYSDFSDMDLSDIDLIRLIQGIEGSHGRNAQLLVTTFNRPNLKGSLFRNCNLTNAKLFGDFDGSNFKGASIINTTFNWCSAEEADFSSAERVIKVLNSNFRDANFSRDTIYGSFENSDLRGVDFDESTFYPYRMYGDPYTNPRNIKERYKFQKHFFAGSTFQNVLLGSPFDLIRYRFDIDEVSLEDIANRREYLARSFFREEFQNEDGGWTYELVIPIDYLLIGKKKEFALLDDDFRFMGGNYKLQDFVKDWKNDSISFNSYIVKSGERYYHPEYNLDRSRRIFTKDTVLTKIDTTFIFPQKDKFCYSFGRIDQIHCRELIPSNDNSSYASFENCRFYAISFSAKLHGISFKGSKFYKTFFKESKLYDIDLTNTRGDVYFDKNTLIDSVLIDKGSFLSQIKKEKEKLLETKVHNYFSKGLHGSNTISYAKYLSEIKNGNIPNGGGMNNTEIEKIFEFISEMEKRLLVDSDSKQFFLRDKFYLSYKRFLEQAQKKSP